MDIFKGKKECVGKVALVATTVTSLSLGSLLYINSKELDESYSQLGKAQKRIVQIEDNNKLLEQEFLSVETELGSLTKKYKALEGKEKEVQGEKKLLEQENSKLKKEVEGLKKIKVDAEKKSNSTVSTSPSGYKNWKPLTVEATGYSLISDELGSDGDSLTATGTYPKAGRTIAVDPRVIPYGTEVYIPAMGGVFIAEDTGGMIKGNKIDIYMSHGDIARKWGRQSIQIYVNL